jgi:phenylalanyl-tRNA synthetase beta chain
VAPLRPRRCNAVLGASYPTERIVEILSSLGLHVQTGDPIQVTVPTYRPDIRKEIDLIEEIARIQGYESIPDAIDNIGPLFTPLHAVDRFEDGVRLTLTGAGFDEIIGHGLADSTMATLLNPELPQVRIIAPVSEDLDIMRNDLALTALSAVSHNVAHRNVDLKLFEIGRAYFPPDEQGVWVEEDRLMLLVTGKTDADWRTPAREMDFFDLSGGLQCLATHFHWPALTFEPKPINYFTADLSFDVRLGGESVGWIGCLDQEIARRADIKQPVYLAQIRIDNVRQKSTTLVAYQPLPAYPAAPRDLAAVVDAHVKVGDLVDLVKKRAGDIAESVDIFDLYVGKQIGTGKKSIGIAIVYRSADRSLSSEEVDQRQAEIVADLKKVFNAEIRDK